MVVVDGAGARVGGRMRLRGFVALAGSAALALVVGIELAAHRYGFEGPTANLLHDVAFGPKRGPVLWAALALSAVGLRKEDRIRCVAAAAAIDLVFFLGRAVAGTRPTFGNGALIVLLALGAWAMWRWQGVRRVDAMKGVLIGFTLIMATKVSDAWLRITVITQPRVLDEYVATADRSLGYPAWAMGRFVDATGFVGHLILQTVYIELPVAAIIVAIFQLRRGWPAHHIVRTFVAIGVVGPICYLLFPVVGPVFAYGGSGKGFAVANVWPAATRFDLHPTAVLFDDVTPRNCMPSLHTAWAVAIFIHTRRGPMWLRRFGAFWLVATLMATLGFGYHYGVDLVAGVVFALTVESALHAPERGWGWWRWRLVGGGALTLAMLLLSYRYLAVPIAELSIVTGPLLLGVMTAVIYAFHATFFAPALGYARDRRLSGALVGPTAAASSA